MSDGSALQRGSVVVLDGVRFLVVSHPCDLARPEEVEPSVELVRINSIEELNGSLTGGKSSRLLHASSGSDLFELAASDRRIVARSSVALSGEALPELGHEVARWLAARLTRTAMPDTFVERLSPERSKIRKHLKTTASGISGIWLALQLEELPDDEVYEVEAIGTMTVEDYQQAQLRYTALESMDGFALRVQACDGIVMVDHGVESEADFSLHDVATMVRFDTNDDLSYSAGA